MTYALGDLTNDDAQVLANALDMFLESPLSLATHTRQLVINARDSIREQIPVPVPAGIGAVVQTREGQFVRWAFDVHTHSPWIAVGDHETPLRTDQIGRISQVLSPGADL